MLDIYIDIKNHLVHGLIDKLRFSINDANNYQTTGYKAHETDFSTLMARKLSPGTSSKNPVSISGSAILNSVTIDWRQGPITKGGSMDMAIVGEGFLMVSENSFAAASAANSYVYTRKGRFSRNSRGEVVDSEGRCLYGYRVDERGEIIDGELVKIQTDHPDVGFIDGGYLVENFEADRIFQEDRDAAGLDKTGAPGKMTFKVALTTFSNKDGLLETIGTAFKETVSSGERISEGSAGSKIAEGNAATYGGIIGGALEGSNVDVAKLSLDLNQINREFSAVQGTMDNVTKVFSGLISKILG